MNVFLHEIRAYRKSTLIWIASLSSIVVVFMAMYPAFTQDVEAVKRVLNNFPEAFRAAIGLNFETFFTVLGFYGYILSFAVLAAAIQAMNLGTGVISKEHAGKTADFLLSKPVTRARVVSAKLAAAFAAIVVTNIVFVAVSYVGMHVASAESFSTGTFLLMALSMFVVQVIFMALGVLFSVTIPKIKSVVAVSLPTVFAFYIIGTIGDVVKNEEARFVSPFRYFDFAYIIKNQSYETKYLAVGAAFVVVAIVASYVIYAKKDIRAAA